MTAHPRTPHGAPIAAPETPQALLTRLRHEATLRDTPSALSDCLRLEHEALLLQDAQTDVLRQQGQGARLQDENDRDLLSELARQEGRRTGQAALLRALLKGPHRTTPAGTAARTEAEEHAARQVEIQAAEQRERVRKPGKKSRAAMLSHFAEQYTLRLKRSISRADAEALDLEARTLPVIGRTSGAAAVKRVHFRGDDLYLICTRDTDGQLTLQTVYAWGDANSVRLY